MAIRQGSELDAAGHLIIPSLDFQDRGSHLNRAVGGAPITATDDGDGADLALIPNLYYVHSYDDRLKFGAAVNVPFAFLTDYEGGWQGRYHALRSEGFVINLNTSVAYRSTSYCRWASVSTPSISMSPSATLWISAPCAWAPRPRLAARWA